MTVTPAHPLAELADPVDRKSPLPAWAQVERSLRQLIEQGLGPGSQLPTEIEMASIYGVSRITIRQALSELADLGYVERRQGTGTFVADRPQLVQHDFGLTEPWRDRFQAAGQKVESLHLVDAEPEREPNELARELSPSERTKSRLHLKRLHLVNDRPIGLTDSWMVGSAAAALADVDLIDGSVSKTLESVGITSTVAEHFLDVRLVSSTEATLLQTGLDSQVFVVWSVSRAEGALIETSRTVWLGSRVRFHYVTGSPESSSVQS